MVPVQLVRDYFGLDGADRKDLIRRSYWNQYVAFNNRPLEMRSDHEYSQIVKMHDKVSQELVAYIAVLMARTLVRRI